MSDIGRVEACLFENIHSFGYVNDIASDTITKQSSEQQFRPKLKILRNALQLECVREAESDRAKLPDRVDHRLDGWLESATVNSRERCTTNRLK